MIVNPRAGLGLGQPNISQAVDILREAGWQLDVVITQAAGHALALSAEAVDQGREVVIACGGDGTINEVIQPLVGSETALAVIPKGTVNAFAREFGLPREPTAAARLLGSGGARALDVGRAVSHANSRANGRYFLLWTGVGFDAEVVRRAALHGHLRMGLLPYVASTVEATLTFEGAEAEIEIDGDVMRQKLLAAIVSNVRGYAIFPLSPSALPDDGSLDLHLFAGSGLATKLRLLTSFLLGRHENSPGFTHRRMRTATFRTHAPLPFHVDGELAGMTPVSCEVVPRALKVILPT